jgi:hypothetical protein
MLNDSWLFFRNPTLDFYGFEWASPIEASVVWLAWLGCVWCSSTLVALEGNFGEEGQTCGGGGHRDDKGWGGNDATGWGVEECDWVGQGMGTLRWCSSEIRLSLVWVEADLAAERADGDKVGGRSGGLSWEMPWRTIGRKNRVYSCIKTLESSIDRSKDNWYHVSPLE